MAGGAKDRLDRLVERLDRVKHVTKCFDDLLSSHSRRLSDVSDGLRKCCHLIEAVTLEVILLKEAGSISLGTREGPSHVKIPEPSPFDGIRSA